MIRIVPADATLLHTLEKLMPGGMPDTHQRRFAVQQKNMGIYLVACEGDRPVGYMLLHTHGPTHAAAAEHAPDCYYIEGLTVSPEKRRQGIAIQLLEAAEAHARKNHQAEIGLAVGVSNVEARALYKKQLYRKEAPESFWVEWPCMDKATGKTGTEGEWCEFWLKTLSRSD